MNKDKKLNVILSKQTTSVSLAQQPGMTLQYLMTTRQRWVSWFELNCVGVIRPDEASLELQQLGALIQKKYKTAVDSEGEVHDLVPHYKYGGWHIDVAQNQCNYN